MDPKILTTHPISLCLWQWEKDIKNLCKCRKKAEWKVQSTQTASIKLKYLQKIFPWYVTIKLTLWQESGELAFIFPDIQSIRSNSERIHLAEDLQMEKYAFSRAAYYVSINYPVSPWNYKELYHFYAIQKKCSRKLECYLVVDMEIAIFHWIHHSGFSVCLLEIGWHHHPSMKELWKLFWFKKRCWKEIQALVSKEEPLSFYAGETEKLGSFSGRSQIPYLLSSHPASVPTYAYSDPTNSQEARCIFIISLFHLVVGISLKFLTHCLKYKWPPLPLWTNRKARWKQLSSSQNGVLSLELTNSAAWSLDTERLPWQTRSTIITIWWKSLHEYVLHR